MKEDSSVGLEQKCDFENGVYLSFSNSLLSFLALSRPRRRLHRNHSSFSSSIGAMEADRRVGVAVDFSACSKAALRWAVENLVRNGDHLVVVNVQKEGHYEEGVTQLWETTGSPFIPLSELSDSGIAKKYGVKPDAETLDILNTVARQKEVVVVLKIYWGDAREKICEAIDSIPLSCLIIGNRGLGKLKRVLLGSVSSYVVNNGTCPVTVVKSTDHAS